MGGEAQLPGLIALGLGQIVGVLVVLDVILAQVVLGSPHRIVGSGALHLGDEGGGGLVEGHHHSVVVPLGDLGGLPHVHVGDAGGQDGVQVLLSGNVLIPEHEVISGEGSAVGPLHALAQVQDILGEIVVHVIALDDEGLSRGCIRHNAHQGNHAQALGIHLTMGGAETAGTIDTAVDADFLSLGHIGFKGQALFHGGQVSGFHLSLEGRGFAIGLAFRKGGGRDQQAQHQEQGDNAFHTRNLLFDLSPIIPCVLSATLPVPRVQTKGMRSLPRAHQPSADVCGSGAASASCRLALSTIQFSQNWTVTYTGVWSCAMIPAHAARSSADPAGVRGALRQGLMLSARTSCAWGTVALASRV